MGSQMTQMKQLHPNPVAADENWKPVVQSTTCRQLNVLDSILWNKMKNWSEHLPGSPVGFCFCQAVSGELFPPGSLAGHRVSLNSSYNLYMFEERETQSIWSVLGTSCILWSIYFLNLMGFLLGWNALFTSLKYTIDSPPFWHPVS